MYQIGIVQAETLNDLGNKAVNHVGLALPDDELIGRKVRFKTPKCLKEEEIFTIVGRQKAYGYDEYGNYTILDAYRGAVSENDFGRPLHLYEVEFVD